MNTLTGKIEPIKCEQMLTESYWFKFQNKNDDDDDDGKFKDYNFCGIWIF